MAERLLQVGQDLADGVVPTELSREVGRGDMYESPRLGGADDLELEVMQAQRLSWGL